jgi:hypothetical protein
MVADMCNSAQGMMFPLGPGDLHLPFICRRINHNQIKTYAELFPYIPVGRLLNTSYPLQYELNMAIRSEDTFVPNLQKVSFVSAQDASAYNEDVK